MLHCIVQEGLLKSGKISSLRLLCVFMLYGMFLSCKHPAGWLQHEVDTKVSAPYLRMCTFLATSLRWWCLGEGAVALTRCWTCSHLVWHVLGSVPFMLEVCVAPARVFSNSICLSDGLESLVLRAAVWPEMCPGSCAVVNGFCALSSTAKLFLAQLLNSW